MGDCAKNNNPNVGGALILVGCLIMFVLFYISVGLLIERVWEQGYNQLARQIAEGTHKVEATTNDFGTLEWRVVEVDKEGMEE